MLEKRSQKSHLVEHKALGSMTKRAVGFNVYNPAIMIVITMWLFCACCVLNHCKVEPIKIGVFGIFTSEMLPHRGQYLKQEVLLLEFGGKLMLSRMPDVVLVVA